MKATSTRRFDIEKLKGLLLPITTPFTSDGGPDLPGLRSNISQWNKTGIGGYVVLGSTGERVHLNEREYVEVIKTARSEVPEHFAFIAGAGQQSTIGTVEEIKRAESAGADAVLVITPHFYRAAITQETLITHYHAVADGSPVPIILYSMPDLTGIKIQPETAAILSEHENIVGIKDSSSDVASFRELVQLVSENFAVLTGNGTVLRDALSAGAHGAILAVACVVPQLSLDIIQASQESDQERAALLQEKLTPLARAVTTKYGIGGLKAALDMIGYVGGEVRAPLRAPDENARKEIALLLQSCSGASLLAHEAPPA